MINSKFLAPPLKVGGLEFMDFQSSNFYKELVAVVTPLVVDGQLTKVPKSVNDVIAKYSGFENITFNLIDYGNLAIDTGYISPGNVLDIQGIDHYFPKSQSTLYRWFESNKANFMYGTLDFKTGKVGGAYSKFPFTVWINHAITDFMPDAANDDVVLVERLCCFLIHEIGHAFTGVYAIHRAVIDNYAITSALHWMSNNSYGQSRVAIYEDALRLMEIDKKQVRDLQRIAEEGNDEVIITSLAKLAEQRTKMNSQSLGVAYMNSEVLADVYAVRMGCDKRLIEGVKAMNDTYSGGEGFSALAFSLLMGGMFATVIPHVVVFGTVFVIIGLLSTMTILGSKLVGGEYDSPYRRLLNIYQEQILRLKQSKTLSNADKRKMLADLDEAKKAVDESKNVLEDTAVQRFLTSLFSPGDTRFTQLEHYTKMVLNNEQSVVNAKFQLLGKKD